MTIRNPSPQQLAIFDEFANGTGHVIISARAGTGKTTTIIEGIDHAPEKKILMAAFNKLIAEELKKRLKNPNAEAKTLHSLGMGYAFRAWGPIRSEPNRGRRLAAQATGLKDPSRELVESITKLAALGKNVAPFATIPELVQIASEYNIDGVDLGNHEASWSIEEVAHAAHTAMELATKKDGTVDFDDMVYLPVRLKWIRPTYDLVVIDEAQDMNATQLALATGSCRGRIVVVGDSKQAIYGFRGADSGGLDRLQKELSAKVLSLTTTYRCPKSVVAIAQQIVPDFHAAPSAPEGSVTHARTDEIIERASPGDFILSRTNAPLARTCLALWRVGKKAVVRGRDIAAGLLKIIERIDASTIPELMESLTLWERNMIENLVAQEASETRIQFASDQADTIRELSLGLASPSELVARIKDLFSDNCVGNTIICSSIHKAKGLEADRVWLLADTLYPGHRRPNYVASPEEANIHYVGVTRTKQDLILVRDNAA